MTQGGVGGVESTDTLSESVVAASWSSTNGRSGSARRWSYKERRKELLLALLDDHADSLDSAVDELGRWVDHLRQVGIRGFVAEHTNDADFARPAQSQDQPAAAGTSNEATRAGTAKPAGKKTKARR